MASNNHDNMAWYLYAYSGTRTFTKWRETVTRLFSEFKPEMGSRSASELITKMVCYYCMNVGTMYKGEMADLQFRKCNRWPGFKEAYGDPHHALTHQWNTMRELDAKTQKLRKELAVKSVPPGDIQHEAKHRAARDILLAEIKRRHGDAYVAAADSFVRELVSIYGPEPFIYMNLPESEDRSWKTLLSDREVIPNLLTSYFIERALYETFGPTRLAQMKNASIQNIRSEVQEPKPHFIVSSQEDKPEVKSPKKKGRPAKIVPDHVYECVFSYMRDHGSITRKNIKELLDLTDGQTTWFINKLQESYPEVERVGDTKRTMKYILKEVA